MRGILRFLKGCVCLSVEGRQLERFLNLCRCQKIPLYEIKWVEEHKLNVSLYYKDFFKLLFIRRKTGVRIISGGTTGVS